MSDVTDAPAYCHECGAVIGSEDAGPDCKADAPATGEGGWKMWAPEDDLWKEVERLRHDLARVTEGWKRDTTASGELVKRQAEEIADLREAVGSALVVLQNVQNIRWPDQRDMYIKLAEAARDDCLTALARLDAAPAEARE